MNIYYILNIYSSPFFGSSSNFCKMKKKSNPTGWAIFPLVIYSTFAIIQLPLCQNNTFHIIPHGFSDGW